MCVCAYMCVCVCVHVCVCVCVCACVCELLCVCASGCIIVSLQSHMRVALRNVFCISCSLALHLLPSATRLFCFDDAVIPELSISSSYFVHTPSFSPFFFTCTSSSTFFSPQPLRHCLHALKLTIIYFNSSRHPNLDACLLTY